MKQVTSVVVGGQEVDLGGEYNVEDTVEMLNNMGMENHTVGARPIVTDGVLSFEQTNGEKGNKKAEG